MTVSVQTPVNEYTANGSVTDFVYTFTIVQDSDLKVYLDGEEQVSGFTVDGIGDIDGGTVYFTEAPANGVVVRLVRLVPLERTTDYTEGAGLSSQTLDQDLDRVWQAIQDIDRDVVRQDLLGTLILGGVTLSNIGEPVDADDAATKNYVDSLVATLTGAITFTVQFSQISAVEGTYTILESAGFPFNINKATYITTSGDIDFSVSINGTTVGGLTGINIDDVQGTTNATSGYAVPEGGRVTLTLTNNTNAEGVSISITCTKSVSQT